jgi:large subunit ribosomal protein L15
MALLLNERESLVKKRKRVGRGGSRGGTSGRGMKGQNCRSGGGVSVTFEGGQMPLVRRIPKRGFNNAAFATRSTIINLSRLQEVFADGAQVNRVTLVEHGFLRASDMSPIKILGTGELQKRLILEVEAVSKSVAETVKKLGGEVRLVETR